MASPRWRRRCTATTSPPGAHKTGTSAFGRCGDLERRWYDSLVATPDFAVYADPFYLCDIWLCWKLYSRKGLLALRTPQRALAGRTVVEWFGSVDQILDLGCGFGYTTAGLVELFPDATVTGTNLRETFQFPVAEALGAEYGFVVVDSFACVPFADVVFASEYFEHIPAPIEHLYALLVTARPRYLVIANGFTGRAIGHFHVYEHRGHCYPASEMSRLFNRALRKLGYRKVETNIWNNRPAIWIGPRR